MANNLNQLIGDLARTTEASLTPVTTIMFGGAEQNEYTGPFYALTALSEAVIDVSECTTNIKTRTSASTMGANTSNITIPIGVTIYGDFSTVELDSGTVLAYSKPGTTVTVGS
jgi:hypothetical protein